MNIYKLICLFSLLLLMAGCASDDKTKTVVSRALSAKQLYEKAKSALNNGNYQLAIENYEALESRFPFGAHTEQAQLEIIQAYYNRGQEESALSAARRFIRLHPLHTNVDYCYYMIGLSHFSENDNPLTSILPLDASKRETSSSSLSFDAFQDLLRRFPETRYGADAKQRMVFLRNRLARHEIHVANYYVKRKAYLAALNRGRYVTENFSQTPSVPAALVLMVENYRRLDYPKLAENALSVLMQNYPEHADIERLNQGAQWQSEDEGSFWSRLIQWVPWPS